ncbi:MAG: molybdopterin-dependent oxidoreductase, partial [Gemmatimonadetes bacterium]|nr:molybdopterin-dependent oxidoreductase [Gemmatimonadota bacterium]
MRPQPDTNIAHRFRIRQGEIERGFAEADVVLEDTFRTPAAAHCAMEPHVCIAHFVTPDQLVVYSATQTPFNMRDALAVMFNLPKENVQVIVHTLGGSYGSKTFPRIEPIAAALARLRAANVDDLVSWMVGIQFFLYEDIPTVRGHIFYPDSPWALTSISQPQFWRDGGLFRTRWGDGSVGGLISVDVSDWDTLGRFVPKPARQCTRDEVAREVWGQLKAALNGNKPGGQVLTDSLLHSWHLDADLDYAGGIPPVNSSRLLVHPPGAWALRPDAVTQIPNLVLASDYVRTHTDLASMEGACEAGKRAANGVLDRDASAAARVRIWPLEEPAAFDRWKRLDAALYQRGKPHLFELLHLDNAFVAADVLRRCATITGLARL